jgi:FkbM family methyltransferase
MNNTVGGKRRRSAQEAAAAGDWTIDPAWPRRINLLRHYRINKVLDVGANTGQYGIKLRRSGYRGVIHSFEPMTRAFAALHRTASPDPHWYCHRLALGSKAEHRLIHIAGNSYSSSFLPMLERHVISAPQSKYIGHEIVPVERLDALQPRLLAPGDRVYLKLDVQGFEREVLRGAPETLKRIAVLESELSIVPLYENGVLLPYMVRLLKKLGFVLVSFDHDFVDPRTGEVLQINGYFVRRDPV